MHFNDAYLKILACPMCKNSLYREGAGLRCLNCKEVYLVEDGIPNLLPKDLENEFLNTINHWDKSYSQTGISSEHPLENRYIADTILHIKKFWRVNLGGIFLEAGCGTAENSKVLAREGKKIVGIDFSMNALKIAKSAFDKEGLESLFVCGDLRKMPFKKDVFSFIYAGGSIEHFENTLSSVEELRSVLELKGVITALVPVVSISMLTYGAIYGNLPAVPVLFQFYKFIHNNLLKGKFAMYGYEKSFTVGKIRKIFKSAGLSNIQTGYYSTYYEIKMFKKKFLKDICNKLLKYRAFWPMIYVNGEKNDGTL